MTKEKIHVVFGATGGIGKAVVHELTKRGKEVVGVNQSGKGLETLNIKMIKTDAMVLQDTINAMKGAYIAYNCLNPPYNKWDVLLPSMIENFIKAAEETNTKIVFMDNNYMYGENVIGPYREELEYNARGKKGKIRALVARMLLDAHEIGKIKVTIGRSSDFFGPGVVNSAMGARIFPNIINGKSVNLLGKMDIPRNYAYIEDVANALVTLGENENAYGEVWQIPSAKEITQREFVELIYSECNYQSKINGTPKLILSLLGLMNPMIREVKEMLYSWEKPYTIDSAKYEKHFGREVTPHEEAIKRTVKWFRENYE